MHASLYYEYGMMLCINSALMLISLRLRTNYVIRVMRIKDKGDIDKFK